MEQVPQVDKDEYFRFMATHVASMSDEKRKALIRAIQLVFRAFSEDDTRGVIITLDSEGNMVQMGMNTTYDEAARLVMLAGSVFMQDLQNEAENETKH